MDGDWQPAVDGGFDGWRRCGAGGCGDGDGYAGGFSTAATVSQKPASASSTAASSSVALSPASSTGLTTQRAPVKRLLTQRTSAFNSTTAHRQQNDFSDHQYAGRLPPSGDQNPSLISMRQLSTPGVTEQRLTYISQSGTQNKYYSVALNPKDPYAIINRNTRRWRHSGVQTVSDPGAACPGFV